MSDAIARKSRLAVPVGSGDGTSTIGGMMSSSTTSTTTSSSSSYGGGMMKPSTTSSSTLPTPLSPGINTTRALLSSHYNNSNNSHHHNSSNSNSISTMNPIQYINRLIDVTQMDIQSGLDQMKTLISNRPQAVYKTAYYRKQTKNHWARDDPAFIALQIIFLLVASIAYCIAFRISIISSLSFIVCSILWHFIGSGIIIATVCRDVANRYLNNVSSSANGNVTSNTSSSLYVRQHVEWMYSFDIHCNSFFPVFVVLYLIQFFALPVALGEGYVSLFISNTLYAIAFGWYWYITHLGYRALPFLSNTEIFLFPIAIILLLYCSILITYPLIGYGFNASRVVARLYFIG